MIHQNLWFINNSISKLKQSLITIDPFNCSNNIENHSDFINYLSTYVSDWQGNLYRFGNFKDSLIINGSTYKSAGDFDAFIIKYRALEKKIFDDCGIDFFELYPNPATTHISININRTITNPYSISIIDATGKKFFVNTNKDSFQYIEIESLPTGLYYVILKEEKGVQRVKSS